MSDTISKGLQKLSKSYMYKNMFHICPIYITNMKGN